MSEGGTHELDALTWPLLLTRISHFRFGNRDNQQPPVYKANKCTIDAHHHNSILYRFVMRVGGHVLVRVY